MKVKNILFGILMCTAYLAYSQNSTPVSVLLKKDDTTGIITKTITRAYGNNSISYIEKGGLHYFSAALYLSPTFDWLDYDSVLLKNVEIGADYTVNDFKVVDSSHIYCCGKYTNGINNKAFIAFFNISDFIISNTINFYVIDNLPCNYGDVADLTKIETFFLSNKLHTIAIGYTDASEACILEIVGPKGSTSVTYKVGSSSASEKFNDIAVTDNYVVTVGSIGSPDAAIRRFPKQSIFSNAANNSLVYTYPTNESNPAMYLAEKTDDFLITPVIDDIVAIASYWYYPPLANLGNNLQGTLMRIYNIAPAAAPTMMTSMSLGQNYYSGNWKLKELQYNGSLQMFSLLQDMELPSTQQLSSALSTLDLVNNPTLVQTEYRPDVELTSLDNISNSTYSIMGGFDNSVSTYFIIMGDKISNTSSLCSNEFNGTIYYKSIYGEKEITSDMTVHNQPLVFSYIKFTNNYSTRMVLSCIH
ncbi:MAG: hypothetical protein J6V54_03015 [Bacteroidales bacterium]|nr:hypothetical protein [Bacteroidales bacterium]